MSENIVTRQYIEARVLLERINLEHSALLLAIQTHKERRSKSDVFFAHWPEHDEYIDALSEALRKCEALGKVLQENPPQ